MVLEPLLAVGLAGNVVQFLDFSCKLFSESRKVYRAGVGKTESTREISEVTANLRQLSENLLSNSHGRSLAQDYDLQSIASSCVQCADELLTALDKIATCHSPTPWESFKVCLKTVWKQKRVEEMERRLDRLRSDLILAMQAMLSQDSSAVITMLNELRETNRELNASLSTQIEAARTGIILAMQQLLSEMKRQQGESIHRLDEERALDAQHKETRNLATKLVHLGLIRDDEDARTKRSEKLRQTKTSYHDGSSVKDGIDVRILSNELSKNSRQTKSITSELRLLSMLQYTTMELRHSKITDAHPKTCGQVFSSDFGPWLESKTPIFWISGKAGSGKSTLMKYLIQNEMTELRLRSWAGSLPLIMSSYFFWINGTEIQRSQEGLLRSILYDILRRYPQLCRPTFPNRWHGLLSEDSKLNHVFTRTELLEAFHRLIKNIGESTRICLFIDGLDEYDGDHDDLIDVIKDIAGLPSVKVCLASRPWNVFESAFGETSINKLYLEHVNASDIRLYIKNKLQDRPDFIALQGKSDQTESLVNELIEKANGVFLWVYLVTRSLIHGLQNFDRISDLQRRLRSFPDDLDELFTRMLHSLDHIYQAQAARAFQLALAACRPMTLLNYWYADVEEEEPDFTRQLAVNFLSPSEWQSRNHEISKRLNARCKGLLEVSIAQTQDNGLLESRVDFLHRTVKDFLMTKSIQGLLSAWIPSDFDADIVLCRTILAEIMTVSTPSSSRKESRREIVDNFFHSLTSFQQKHGVLLQSLLAKLICTVSFLTGRGSAACNCLQDGNSIHHCLDQTWREPWYMGWRQSSFLEYTVTWNLHEVVEKGIGGLISRGQFHRAEKESLLVAALYRRRDRFRTLLPPDPRMLTCILHDGPEARIAISLFNKAVKRNPDWTRNPATLFQVLKSLCENGANLEEDTTSYDLLSKIFPSDDVAELFRIQPIARQVARKIRSVWFKWPWTRDKFRARTPNKNSARKKCS